MKKEKQSDDLMVAFQEIAHLNGEQKKRAGELVIAFQEIALLNVDQEKRAAELVIANIELAFQNEQKEKRAAELVLANIELAFQNEEKAKRAHDLIIANNELIFQNSEKEKRAAELVLANIELAFQNEEKAKRAHDLIIANNELIFQSDEKEKRASELVLANIELAFQSKLKGEREQQLVTANIELTFQNEEKEKRAIELLIAFKELESFSYSVSHDLRAPIRAINGFAKILEEDYGNKFDSAGSRALNTIIHNSSRMGVLIDDLLAFSKLGRKELNVSEIDMMDVVESVRQELITSNENEKKFNLKVLPPAKGDKSLIRQVWINLISNAIKFSKNKSKSIIEIDAYEKDDFIVYTVKDNGAGFDMQYYSKLFGVFQRLHSEQEFEGTGIGLAIIQKIIHRHNGTVWAESKLGEGTCFYFSLPIFNA